MDAETTRALRTLLDTRPVAALATLHGGDPAVSMVPFARLPGRAAVAIHVSALAPHTRDLANHAAVALLVTGADDDAVSPLARPRASLVGSARFCEPGSADHDAARAAYLAKLPDAEDLFTFTDFALVVVELRALRYVAGFGRAHALAGDALASLFGAEGAA